MTDREWHLLAAEIEASFRGDLAEDRESALRTHFAGVPYDAARNAVRWLVTHDVTWMPTPAELINALRHSAGFRETRAWLAGHETPEAFERALVAKYHELAETTRRQMPALERGK